MCEMEGITKCPSSSKKRKTDSKWCLEALAQKFDIDISDASAGVLKEHVAHMATLAHLFNPGRGIRNSKIAIFQRLY